VRFIEESLLSEKRHDNRSAGADASFASSRFDDFLLLLIIKTPFGDHGPRDSP
jgi:hypothetical protein